MDSTGRRSDGGAVYDDPFADLRSEHDELSDPLADNQRVLITGPPMSGKYDLLHRLLAERSESLLISTERNAGRVRTDHTKIVDDDRELYVLDCVESETDTTSQYVRTASLRNLTQVGVTFTAFADTLDVGSEQFAIGLYSLSQLLGYWDTPHVLRFTRTLSEQIANRGWPFVATLSSTAHARDVRHAIHEPFDCVVETRFDDVRQLRVRDRLGGSTDWTRF